MKEHGPPCSIGDGENLSDLQRCRHSFRRLSEAEITDCGDRPLVRGQRQSSGAPSVESRLGAKPGVCPSREKTIRSGGAQHVRMITAASSPPAKFPVLIAGGGPVGSSVPGAKLAPTHWGFPASWLEAGTRPGWRGPGSRAIFRRSRPLLEILGWGGAGWPGGAGQGCHGSGGRKLLQRRRSACISEMPRRGPEERFAPWWNIQQLLTIETIRPCRGSACRSGVDCAGETRVNPVAAQASGRGLVDCQSEGTRRNEPHTRDWRSPATAGAARLAPKQLGLLLEGRIRRTLRDRGIRGRTLGRPGWSGLLVRAFPSQSRLPPS